MASRMLDLPEPFSPVMELKLSSLPDGGQYGECSCLHGGGAYHPDITVLTAYDLKPSMISSITLILTAGLEPDECVLLLLVIP
jgi:hypothetical protein